MWWFLQPQFRGPLFTCVYTLWEVWLRTSSLVSAYGALVYRVLNLRLKILSVCFLLEEQHKSHLTPFLCPPGFKGRTRLWFWWFKLSRPEEWLTRVLTSQVLNSRRPHLQLSRPQHSLSLWLNENTREQEWSVNCLRAKLHEPLREKRNAKGWGYSLRQTVWSFPSIYTQGPIHLQQVGTLKSWAIGNKMWLEFEALCPIISVASSRLIKM